LIFSVHEKHHDIGSHGSASLGRKNARDKPQSLAEFRTSPLLPTGLPQEQAEILNLSDETVSLAARKSLSRPKGHLPHLS
jgi:hypothetical protein